MAERLQGIRQLAVDLNRRLFPSAFPFLARLREPGNGRTFIIVDSVGTLPELLWVTAAKGSEQCQPA